MARSDEYYCVIHGELKYLCRLLGIAGSSLTNAVMCSTMKRRPDQLSGSERIITWNASEYIRFAGNSVVRGHDSNTMRECPGFQPAV